MPRSGAKRNVLPRSVASEPVPNDTTDSPVFLSLREASRRSGINYRTLRRAIETGHLKARRFGATGKWWIRLDDLERFLRGDSEAVTDVRASKETARNSGPKRR